MKKILSALLIIFLLFLFIILPLMAPSFDNAEDKPLACLTLPTAEDTYMQLIADTFVSYMEVQGFETQIVYCDNSVITQLKQIQNFITNDARLIAVNCVGNGEEYSDVFREARTRNCTVVALNASTELEHCDVQSKEYEILKGIRQCELVKEYLDLEYPDAEDSSVDVLLLEVSSKTNYVRMSAGQKLIHEKFLRYFDDTTGTFINYPTDESIWYQDESGAKQQVTEACGGLILDGNGNARLNPYYDPRVNLHTITDKNISTNLDAQNAIDYFLISPEGSALRIVMCFSGDAAKGASDRLLYYSNLGMLTPDLNKLAVFGADNTAENRLYVEESADNKSLYRGFMGTADLEWKITAMLTAAVSGQPENLILSETCKGYLDPITNQLEVVYTSESPWENPDIFFQDNN